MNSKKHISSKAGLPPGTLVHVGRKLVDKVQFQRIGFNTESSIESEFPDAHSCLDFEDKDLKHWVNVNGLHDAQELSEVGEIMSIESLVVEDILNTTHRPKFESHTDYVFLTLKMFGLNEVGSSVVSEQVSFILGDKWLISFQEQPGDIFNKVRDRIRNPKSTLRKSNVDYLFYRLIDTVVDYYFHVTEFLGDELQDIEERILDSDDKAILNDLQMMRKRLIHFRKAVLPLREALVGIQKDDSQIISDRTRRFIVDVWDHVTQILETIDSLLELQSSNMDLYYSSISNKTNQIMQVLTIIATIFIPLTFIAGIYGMNFQHMPELTWKYGYYGTWALMVLVATAMLIWFRRRKWL